VGMRERVSLVGGRCAIESRLNQGTHITIDLPVRSEGIPPEPGNERSET
jgi:glucose-6-phosphate-specific signal transduction histidine kinase